jgi:hypothetical protein
VAASFTSFVVTSTIPPGGLDQRRTMPLFVTRPKRPPVSREGGTVLVTGCQHDGAARVFVAVCAWSARTGLR